MELDKVISTRRSVRKYQNKEISLELINQIIYAGSLAPSAHNRQPWDVIVVKKDKSKIVDIMKEYCITNNEDESIIKTANTINNCDTLLLVYCNNFNQLEYNILSVGAMIQNMLLKATDLNIGSVWIANVCPMKEKINHLLNINSNEKLLVSAVALGYPNQELKHLERKKLNEFVSYR